MKEVFDTWNKKVVYTGSQAQCEDYVRGNNVYGYNYSKLRIRDKETSGDMVGNARAPK